MSGKPKVSVGRRVSRALFIGLMIGAFGAVGVYYMNSAINLIAGESIVNAIGMALLVFGASILGSIGIELSSDISD
jgi:multisubunit Na+/H+ antiporter MnhG subunit